MDGARNMIKASAITFDLWDTLIQEYPGGADRVASIRIGRIADLLSAKGIVHSQQEIRNAYTNTGAFLELTWKKNRDMHLTDQVLFMLTCIDSRLPSRLGKSDIENIEKIYAEGIFDSRPRLLQGAAETLEAAKSGGFKVGLICNTGRTPGSVLRVVMSDLGILEYFDSTTFSNEILVRKPAEPAFRTTLEKLKVGPKLAVHVGDHPENDVYGAAKVGMRAAQVLTNGLEPSKMAAFHIRSLDQLLEHVEPF